MARTLPLALTALCALSGAAGGCAHLWPPWPFDGGPDWEVGTSTRLTAYSSSGMPAPTLETLEQAYALLEAALFPGATIAPVDVLLLDWPTFQSGFGVRRTGATVARLPGKGQYGRRGLIVMHAEDATTAGAIHRLTHLFLQVTAPRAPLWLHEGLASYAETAELRTDDKEPVACLGQLPKKQEDIPLSDLFAWSWGELDDSTVASAYRYTASNLIDYLMMGEGGKLRGKFSDLIIRLSEGVGSEAALMKVYPELSAKVLREKLREHRIAAEASPRPRCPIPTPVKAEVFADSAKTKNEPASEEEMEALWVRLRMLPRRAGQVDWYPSDMIGVEGGQYPPVEQAP